MVNSPVFNMVIVESLRKAKESINDAFGKGYAEKNPALIGSVIIAAKLEDIESALQSIEKELELTRTVG